MENEFSMQELLDQQEQAFNSVKVGEIISGKINKISHDEVAIEAGFGLDAIISIEELNIENNKTIDEIYNIGDEITAVITKIYQKDGTIRLSKLQADKRNDFSELEKAHKEHRIITVEVEKCIERGVFAKYKSYTLFIPISQIDTKFVTDTSNYMGANLEVYIMELDPKKNRFVATHREVLKERQDKEREEKRAKIKAEKEAEKVRITEERNAERERKKADKEKLFNSLEVGQKREGKVTKIMSYGAFVDIGGVEGLAHINNLSWKRVESVESILEEGQDVEVYVLDVDKETKRIALALKDINNDPWSIIAKEIKLEDIITGTVVRIIERGAFVEVAEGVEAYLPISELSEERVVKVTNVVNIGDEINAMVINFNPKDRKMMLSIKEATKEPEEDYSEYMETEDSLGTLGDLFKDKFKGLDK